MICNVKYLSMYVYVRVLDNPFVLSLPVVVQSFFVSYIFLSFLNFFYILFAINKKKKRKKRLSKMCELTIIMTVRIIYVSEKKLYIRSIIVLFFSTVFNFSSLEMLDFTGILNFIFHFEIIT